LLGDELRVIFEALDEAFDDDRLKVEGNQEVEEPLSIAEAFRRVGRGVSSI
jgi:hypothetical protein